MNCQFDLNIYNSKVKNIKLQNNIYPRSGKLRFHCLDYSLLTNIFESYLLIVKCASCCFFLFRISKLMLSYNLLLLLMDECFSNSHIPL